MSVAALMSCSKDKDDTGPEVKNKVYTIFQETNTGTKNLYGLEFTGGYSWDGINIPDKIHIASTSSDNQWLPVNIIKYDNGKIIIKSSNIFDQTVSVYELENGKIIESMIYLTTEGYNNNQAWASYKYAYNSNGYLWKVIASDVSFFELIYEKGNIAAIKRTYVNTTTCNLSYSDKKRIPYADFISGIFKQGNNNFSYILGFHESALYESGYFGKISNDRLESVSFNDGKENKLTYEYNDLGEIKTVTKNSYDGIFKYHFQYK